MKSLALALLRLFRLIALMLMGCFIGGAIIGPILLHEFYLYDHGFGETAKTQLEGCVTGALAGVVAELLLRQIRLPAFHFRLRALLIAVTLVAVVFGLIGYVIQSAPRWKEELALAQAARARANAEEDRQTKADLDASKELMNDLEALRLKDGRYPDDQDELIRLRGKPMPLIHPRNREPVPIIYERKPEDVMYRLIYRY